MKYQLLNRQASLLQDLEGVMDEADSFEEWQELATQYDAVSGGDQWRKTPASQRYDHASITRRLRRLRRLRRADDDRGLLFALNEGIHGNMAGMGRANLYQPAKCGTKHLIEDYIDEICAALEHLAGEGGRAIPLVERFEFFQRASHCYGRSALMLSGGGTLGYFHFGVLKALVEQQLCPVVISGASAGAFVAAVMGTRTDREFLALFEDNYLARAMTENRGKIKIGFGMDAQVDMPAIRREMGRLIPDMTFLEAYEKTGRSINITISPAEPKQESRLLNHVASPNVTILSAVLASSALPGVFPPVQLEAKDDHGAVKPYLPKRRWIDGSFSQDLPAKRLARLYGVNHFIVSQVMPGLGREPSTRPGIYQIISDAWVAATKKLVRGSLDAVQRYTRVGARTGSVLNALNGLIDQQFTGDINIFPGYGYSSLGKLLKVLTEEEMRELIKAGERGTWPKIPIIRTTTRIGRTIDKILHHYELEQTHWLKSSPNTEEYRSAASAPAKGRKRASSAAPSRSKKKPATRDRRDPGEAVAAV
ncbi:MAG: DUF3336 domain-containing protein [Halioglobus sp.]|nr:DUF3336 domain-containing protein [Halioglobus sp.]